METGFETASNVISQLYHSIKLGKPEKAEEAWTELAALFPLSKPYNSGMIHYSRKDRQVLAAIYDRFQMMGKMVGPPVNQEKGPKSPKEITWKLKGTSPTVRYAKSFLKETDYRVWLAAMLKGLSKAIPGISDSYVNSYMKAIKLSRKALKTDWPL